MVKKAGGRTAASVSGRQGGRQGGRKSGQARGGTLPRRSFRWSISPTRQRELAGALIVAVSVVSVAAMLTGDQGTLARPWLELLRWLFGWAHWAVVIAFGALGAWLVLDAVDGEADVDWSRPIAGATTGVVILAILHLVGARAVAAPEAGQVAVGALPLLDQLRALAEAGGGGGRVGYGVAYAFARNLGALPSLAALAVLALVGTSVTAGVTVRRSLDIIGQGLFHVGRPIAAGFVELGGLLGRFRAVRPTDHAPVDEPVDVVPLVPEIGGTDGDPAAEIDPAGSDGAPLSGRVEDELATIPDGPESPDRLDRPLSRPLWRLPDIDVVLEPEAVVEGVTDDAEAQARVIEETLGEFGVPARIVTINRGPRVTQFGLEPGHVERNGVRSRIKVSRIVSLQNDLALALAAAPIRVQAPVPGRPYVGIEIPNQGESLVSLRAILESDSFKKVAARGGLPLALGRDISGREVAADLTGMPHLLIAGATGAGKSVAINTLICSLLMTNTPAELKLLLIDPKRVELAGFRGLPHLASPVVVEIERVVGVLQWAVREMDRRYREFAAVGARNIANWNRMMDDQGRDRLPYLVIVIDELADLMMVAPEEAERLITRLAQLARATGIHLVLATQRPSVDVVTGLIKANFPSRIAFAVSSAIDSRVILDTAGAEKLLGRGDMLYTSSDSSKLKRLQGCFVSDAEIERLTAHWRNHPRPGAESEADTSLTLGLPDPLIQPDLWEKMLQGEGGRGALAEERDDLWQEAVTLVRAHRTASTSFLQRKLRIGYSRAARMLDSLEEAGVVGPAQGNAGREVLGESDEPEEPTVVDFRTRLRESFESDEPSDEGT